MTYKSKKEYKAAIADLLDSIRDIEEAVYEDYLDDDDDLESNWEESDSSWYNELCQARKELTDLQESYSK